MEEKKLKTYSLNKVIAIMFVYQLISKIILIAGGFLFRSLTALIMWSADRPAITSGDLPFFLRSWQGWVLIIFGLLALLFYIAIDINLSIILCDKLLRGERLSFAHCFGEAIHNIKFFLGFRGILLVLYIAFIAPIVGAPFNISLTRGFVVPDFIMSFIQSHIPLLILYGVFLVVFLAVGLMGIFDFHYINIKKQSVKAANHNSRQLIKQNFKHLVKTFLRFVLIATIVLAVGICVTCIVPLCLNQWMNWGSGLKEFNFIFAGLLLIVFLAVYFALLLAYTFIRLTRNFGECDKEMKGTYLEFDKSHKSPWILIVLCIVVVIGGVSGIMSTNFDKYFPPLKNIDIIAHRAGGELANENTVIGVKKAIEYGAYGSETDVQRTKDGYYIINHDDDFSRLCGVDKTPSEMTLKEIKALRVKDEKNTGFAPQEIPTLQEFLDSGKGKIKFYIELKGKTADKKMADDIYQIVKSKGMLNQSVFIGLDYNLIDYIAKKYSDAQTGYLCFFSIGEIEDLDCNVLMPEMETATSSNIAKIRGAGKRVDVWTVNSINAIVDFLLSDATGIVTDKVEDAMNIREVIMDNQDFFRVIKPMLN